MKIKYNKRYYKEKCATDCHCCPCCGKNYSCLTYLPYSKYCCDKYCYIHSSVTLPSVNPSDSPSTPVNSYLQASEKDIGGRISAAMTAHVPAVPAVRTAQPQTNRTGKVNQQVGTVDVASASPVVPAISIPNLEQAANMQRINTEDTTEPDRIVCKDSPCCDFVTGESENLKEPGSGYNNNAADKQISDNSSIPDNIANDVLKNHTDSCVGEETGGCEFQAFGEDKIHERAFEKGLFGRGLYYYRKWWELSEVDLFVNGDLLTGIPIFTDDNTLRVVSGKYSYFIPLEKIDYIRTADGLNS